MNIGKKISSKDYKKCCYHWRIGAIIIFLIFSPYLFYVNFFRIVNGTKIDIGETRIVLPKNFYFLKKEYQEKNGIRQVGEIYRKYSLIPYLIISDISNVDYGKKKKIWFSKKNCVYYKKKWQKLDIDAAVFLSSNFKNVELFVIVIPKLKILISSSDSNIIQEFMIKAKFSKIKK